MKSAAAQEGERAFVRKHLTAGVVTHEEWSAIYKTIQSKLGKSDCYWMVFEMYSAEKPEP